MLTDLGSTLAVTTRNVAWNKDALAVAAARGGSVGVHRLDWLAEGRQLPTVPAISAAAATAANDGTGLAAGGWDLVLGSDILYDGRCYEALASVIHEAANIGSSRTQVVLSWSVSPNQKLLDRFWQTMRRFGFSVEFSSQQSVCDLLGESGLYERYADASDCADVSLAVLALTG